ncbi:MAG: ABC transporter ATP-binding protein [Deltaproteobacteria bacterium]|nr:ABC transporter ATP-binding protein [Deltaproteobacteria bacterium]
MAKLVVENISKKFGAEQVLDQISLVVEEGEFFALLGPSGSGKSTLLRLIAGLEVPDRGRIFLNGADITNVPPERRDMAMVFQSYALYPHMTVFDNIAVGLKLRRVPRAEIGPRVGKVAAMLEIDGLLHRKPRALSGGQRQRVALGRAIVRRPQIFLFDEPLGSLDAALRERTRAELKMLMRQLQATVVHVTHDQMEALTLADRVAVLANGRLQQVGKPRELYQHPANRLVASFIGSPPMNLWLATRQEQGWQLSPHWILPRQSIAAQEEQVWLGIRPEEVQVSPTPVFGAWEARVKLVEYSGAASILTIERSGLPVRAITQAAPGYHSGQTVWITLAPDGFHVFRHPTGERL